MIEEILTHSIRQEKDWNGRNKTLLACIMIALVEKNPKIFKKKMPQ